MADACPRSRSDLVFERFELVEDGPVDFAQFNIQLAIPQGLEPGVDTVKPGMDFLDLRMGLVGVP